MAMPPNLTDFANEKIKIKQQQQQNHHIKAAGYL